MSTSRPHTRLRRLAGWTGAIALTGALALSATMGGVEETDAAWTDAEAARAQLKASWMQGFTRVTEPGWKMRGDRDSDLPGSIAMSGPNEATRDFVLSYPQLPGTTLATGSDDERTSFGSPTSSEIVPSRTTTNDLWMGRYVTGVSGQTDIARAGHCMSFPEPAIMTAPTTSCFATSTPTTRLAAHQNSAAYTFSIMASGAGTKRARVNVAGFASTALCSVDGSSRASIDHSNSTLQLANEISTFNYSFSREESIKGIIPTADDPTLRYDGTSNQWMRYNVQLSGSDPSFVLAANVRKNTYVAPFYALAEMDLIVQIYSSGGASGANGRFIDQINLPLTRSECGFSNGTGSFPTRAGTWRGDAAQLGWPGRSLGTTVPSNASRLEQFTFTNIGSAPTVTGGGPTVQSAPRHVPGAINPHPSGTPSPTSPLESAADTQPTTSGPPEPSSSGAAGPPATQASTSTSATPATAAPEAPGPLSPAARIEEVGLVELDGRDLVVVVTGASVPADADQGTRALDRWLTDGIEPRGDWTAFTSGDPEQDGWRWAAVNRSTGTVLYIR